MICRFDCKLIKAALVSIVIAVTVLFTGCGIVVSNYQYLDTTNHFDEAIISLPDGEVVKGKVKSWRDYEDGDQIQVTIGKKTYLVHSSDIALIANHES